VSPVTTADKNDVKLLAVEVDQFGMKHPERKRHGHNTVVLANALRLPLHEGFDVMRLVSDDPNLLAAIPFQPTPDQIGLEETQAQRVGRE
jgi:hypothetical protein